MEGINFAKNDGSFCRRTYKYVTLYEERASQGNLQQASKSGKIPFSVYF
ncbi:hypothetical protein MQW34_26735 [Bacillus sp. ZJS3]|nr:hypothetical protein MQW34_26735 [Bacillus sp. ZJS3]